MTDEYREKKDVLAAFENGRGFAYLVGAFSIFGPTTIELLVRDRPLFLALEWQKILLLCASVGGSFYVLSVIASSLVYKHMLQEEEVSRDRKDQANLIMVIGGFYSLMAQAIAMIATAHSSIWVLIKSVAHRADSFLGYVAALTSMALFLGSIALYGVIRITAGDKEFRNDLRKTFVSEFRFAMTLLSRRKNSTSKSENTDNV